MATLTIRNLPDDLHESLKERARRNRRSLNQQVIAELAAARPMTEEERLAEARRRMRQATEKIDAMRAKLPRFLSADEIDAAIREGRK